MTRPVALTAPPRNPRRNPRAPPKTTLIIAIPNATTRIPITVSFSTSEGLSANSELLPLRITKTRCNEKESATRLTKTRRHLIGANKKNVSPGQGTWNDLSTPLRTQVTLLPIPFQMQILNIKLGLGHASNERGEPKLSGIYLQIQMVGQVLLTIISSPPMIERKPKNRQISA